MSNFETDNQDKSNLVGNSKVMSDAVNVEQERLALIDEVSKLQDLVIDNIATILSYKEKAKAWDDLEAVMNTSKGIEINMEGDHYYIDNLLMGKDLKIAISHELESIKGGE